jgi:hypothetical protein
MIESVEGLAGGKEFDAEGFDLAAGGGVCDNDGGSHLGHKAVAGRGGLCGDMSRGVREGRHHDQPAFGGGRTAVNGLGWNLAVQSAGETPDDRVRGPKEDAQAFLFHRGVKAADDGGAIVPESLGEIVGIEDEFTGALDGAEESDLREV